MDTELKKIQSEVHQLTNGTTTSVKKKKFGWGEGETKKIMYTSALFLIVLSALFFFKPFFLYRGDVSTRADTAKTPAKEKPISVSRLIVFAFIFTIICIIIYELLENWKFLKM
jgi:hypothetical protein